jgi:Rieske Fe-S protein
MEMTRRNFVVVASAAAVATCACGGLCAAKAADTDAAAASLVDVGVPSDYAKDGAADKFAKEHKVLVVRSGARIYAPTARCTHKGCTLKPKDGTLACPCHSSKFSLEGSPTGGPAKKPLVRHGIFIDAAGHLVVDKSKQYEQPDWENPGAYVEV